MPIQIPVNFEVNFDSNTPLVKNIGRIYLGEHCLRLFLDTDGKIKGHINTKAITDGSLILGTYSDQLIGFPDANPSPASRTP